MRQLQCTYTTQEQSRLLLKIGVPAESADMRYLILAHGAIVKIPYVVKNPSRHKHGCKFIPCWSVGRLIEIFNLVTDARTNMLFWMTFPKYKINNYAEFFVLYFEELKGQNKLDFSKLED